MYAPPVYNLAIVGRTFEGFRGTKELMDVGYWALLNMACLVLYCQDAQICDSCA